MSSTTRPDPPGRMSRPGLILLASLLGLFIALLDVTVVTVALPTIQRDLGGSFRSLEWVANAYILALSVFIVTAGRLGDLLGQRRIYVAGVVVFLLGSLGCGLAGTGLTTTLGQIGQLHTARAVQGLGGAIILPLSLAIIYSSFEGRQRSIGIISWGAVGGLATALGPLVGGLLVDHAGWEWIFLVNLPIGALVIVAACMAVATETPDIAAAGRAIDVPGLVTISGALLCLNLALINGAYWRWSSGRVLLLFIGAGVLLLVFLLAESRSSAPILDLGWFRRPSFGGSMLAALLLGAGMFAVLFFLSFYLQNALGFSALGAGYRLLPLTFMIIVGAPLGGRLAAALGVRKALSLGFVAMAVGLALLTRSDAQGDAGSWTLLLPGLLLTGLTLGVIMPMSSELAVASAPQDAVGVAASVGTMFRQVGNAVGIAVIGALLTAQTDAVQGASAAARQKAVTRGMDNGAWYAVAVSLAAALGRVSLCECGWGAMVGTCHATES